MIDKEQLVDYLTSKPYEDEWVTNGYSMNILRNKL